MPFYVGGSAGMRNMGTYAAGTTYFPNDVVFYAGSSYVAIATTTGNLPTNVTYWGVLAAAGAAATGGGGEFLPWSTPGRYYHAPIQPSQVLGGQSVSVAMTFQPVRIPNSCTLASLGIYCNSSPYTVYLGLFSDAGAVTSGGPGTRIAATTFTSVSGAYGSLTLNLAVSSPTTFWVATCASSTSMTTNTIPTTATLVNFSNSYAAGQGNGRTTTTYSTSALPPADISGVALTGGQPVQVPVVMFIVA